MTRPGVGTIDRPALDTRVVVAVSVVAALTILAFEFVLTAERYGAIRAVVGVVGAFVLPGYLLLRLAGLDSRRPSRTLGYAVGVSVAFLLVTGMATNVALAGAGVERPLAWTPATVALSVVVLAGATYLRTDRAPTGRPSHSFSRQSVLAGGLLALLPILSAVTATSGGGAVAPTVVLVGLLAGSVCLLVTGVIPAELRPFAVWSVALAVQFQTTLVTDHIWGWDVHFQYRTADLIYGAGLWGPSGAAPSGSLLVTTFLPAVASFVTDLELVWVYKLLLPCLVAFLPVGVYHLGTLQFDDEWVATLAPFALVFYYGYFKFMPGKQMLAQLFFVLALVVTFDDSVEGVGKRALAVTFAGVMVLAHYVVSLAFVVFLAATVVSVAVARRVGLVDRVRADVVRPTFVALVGVGWVGWYGFSSGGRNLERIAVRAYEALLVTGGGAARSGASYATIAFESPVWAVYRLLYVALIGLFAVGVLRTLYAVVVGTDERVDAEYVAFSAFALAFLAASVVVTFSLGFDRALLMVLPVLAPFVLVGLRAGVALPARLSGRLSGGSPRGTAAVLAAFLAVLFLFSSGAAFAAAGEEVPAYNINLEEDAGWPVYERSDVAASRWVATQTPADSTIGVYNQWSAFKSRDSLLLQEVVGSDRLVGVLPSSQRAAGAAFVYVSERPMVVEIGEREYIAPGETVFHAGTVSTASKVYTSGSAAVYVPPEASGAAAAGNATGARRGQSPAVVPPATGHRAVVVQMN
jgi:uncharacterized membrane protein